MLEKKRWVNALRMSAWHLAASAALLVILGWIFFNFWYPQPYRQLAGLSHFLLWPVVVDVVCGPMLTLLLYSSRKSNKELALDMGLIVVIQLVALAYGIYSLAQVRPVATVFEVDRFRVISAADVYEEESSQLPHWFNSWNFSGPKIVGIKSSNSGAELLKSMDLSTSGIEPSQRPSRWQPYSESAIEAAGRAQPLQSYPFRDASGGEDISKQIILNGGNPVDLKWLPVQGRSTSQWNLLLNATTGVPFAFFDSEGELVMWQGPA